MAVPYCVQLRWLCGKASAAGSRAGTAAVPIEPRCGCPSSPWSRAPSEGILDGWSKGDAECHHFGIQRGVNATTAPVRLLRAAIRLHQLLSLWAGLSQGHPCSQGLCQHKFDIWAVLPTDMFLNHWFLSSLVVVVFSPPYRGGFLLALSCLIHFCQRGQLVFSLSLIIHFLRLSKTCGCDRASSPLTSFSLDFYLRNPPAPFPSVCIDVGQTALPSARFSWDIFLILYLFAPDFILLRSFKCWSAACVGKSHWSIEVNNPKVCL